MSERVRIARNGTPGRVRVSPMTRLGDRFGLYLEACRSASARFDPEIREQTCELSRVPVLVSALQHYGFEPVVADEVRTECAAVAATVRSDVDSADARLARIEAELATRGKKLYPFQREGVRWLAGRKRALLGDEMGVGKSAQALAALPDDAPVAIVCPACVKLNWKREIEAWRPDYAGRVRILEGREKWAWPEPGQIVVGNYETLPVVTTGRSAGGTRVTKVVHPHYGVPAAGTIAIFDEAHYAKNSKSGRTQRSRAVAQSCLDAGGRVWALTGTPLVNRPPELWSVLVLAGLHRDAFPEGWLGFVRLFEGSPGEWGGYSWGQPHASVPERIRKVMLKRLRKDVLPDLPRKARRQVGCSSEFPREVTEICNELVEMLKARGVDLDTVVEISQLTQAGVDFGMIARARAALATAKLPEALRWAEQYEEAEEPVVFFACHLNVLEVLACRPGWGKITGDEPVERRQATVEAFQAGQLKGLAVSIRAGGVGITLTAAHEAVFVDLDWTPAGNTQAEDRLCRIGQKSAVTITQIVAPHPLDERVAELIARKQAIIDASIEAAAVTTAPVEDHATAFEAVAGLPRLSEPAPEEPAGPKPRRAAKDEGERWAERGILLLAGLDPDRAGIKNDAGFNKLDGAFGHQMASEIQAGRGLTEAQWAAVVKLASRYTRQTGRKPEGGA